MFTHKRWSLGKLTCRGGWASRLQILKTTNTVPRHFRARPALASTGQESVWRQVYIFVCVERKSHRWTWRKKKIGSIKSISAFCSESSAAYPKTFQNQTRCWGRSMQSGFLLEGSQDYPFDNFNVLYISTSMLWLRWWEIKRRNWTSLVSLQWFQARPLSSLPSTWEPSMLQQLSFLLGLQHFNIQFSMASLNILYKVIKWYINVLCLRASTL